MRLSPKKKVFTDFDTDFSAKIGNSNVFSAQFQVISKKKRSSPILRLEFRPKSEIRTFDGGCFPMGDLFSIFHQKSASKAPKTCDFAYFTSQWGSYSPPRPPWLRYWVRAKLQITRHDVIKIFRKEGLFMEQRYHKMEVQKSGPGIASTLDFAKGKGLEPKN